MSDFDQRLRAGLRTDHESAPDMDLVTSDVSRRRVRRSAVRRLQAIAVVAALLGGLVTGLVVLDRRGDTRLPVTNPSLSSGATNSPQPSPEPSPASSPGAKGVDIGIGTNVCRATRLDGLDLLSTSGSDTAWTGFTVTEAGTCPQDPGRQRWIVAVDLDGDGVADASAEMLEVCSYTGCVPLDATDLDNDGDGELIVMTRFSIIDHLYFSVATSSDGTHSIDPILVAEPGHPAALIDPGVPLITSAAGDAGYAAWIRCEGYPQAPVLVHTWVSSIIDSPEPSEWHETKLELRDDGLFHVIATNDFTMPQGRDPGLLLSQEPACGVNFAWINR